MKEATQRPADMATARPPTASSTTSPSAVAADSCARRNAHTRAPALPVGFFDDAAADAKARHVDVQQLAATQLASDWEAFQEFAAEVEQRAVEEERVQVQETKEREAVDELENMQYVDRYRVALERVARLRSGKKTAEKRHVDEANGDVGAVDDDDDDLEAPGAGIVQAAVREFQHKQKKKKRKQQQQQTSNKQQREQVASNDLDELDLCNWRSRGL
ncbi:unnamed protein product [Hyaloperonospora brassicae]|uniref:ZNF380 coiled-coil domain-containing protein n=1 Tax=Hyaloperonospora brassicae TaxID=162125 RepID=A0AAV0UK68_HYABA|nr:unnamed protein product [Hyaloperonospora brassicae]